MVDKLVSNAWNQILKGLRAKGIHMKRIGYGDYWNQLLRPQLDEKTYVNVGAGDFRLGGWQLLDYETPDYEYPSDLAFVQYDLTSGKPMPFRDGVVDGIYCSHVIEHFKNDIAFFLFKEFERVLRPGGVARIATPDAALAWRALKSGDEAFFIWDYWNASGGRYKSFATESPATWAIEHKWLHRFATERVPMDRSESDFKMELEEVREYLDSMSYHEIHDALTAPLTYKYEKSSNHINWFDYEKLSSIVAQSSNLQVQKSAFLQSIDSQMRVEGHFDATWPQMSMFVDLVKE